MSKLEGMTPQELLLEYDRAGDEQSGNLSAWAEVRDFLLRRLGASGVPGWKCFHCDEVFTDEEAAEKHFGCSEHDVSECLRSRIAGRDKVSEELANWHRHKQQLIMVLTAFCHENPKWKDDRVDNIQDPCGAHALLEWIEQETWFGFDYPGYTAQALAVLKEPGASGVDLTQELLAQLQVALKVPTDRVWFGTGLLEVVRMKVAKLEAIEELAGDRGSITPLYAGAVLSSADCDCPCDICAIGPGKHCGKSPCDVGTVAQGAREWVGVETPPEATGWYWTFPRNDDDPLTGTSLPYALRYYMANEDGNNFMSGKPMRGWCAKGPIEKWAPLPAPPEAGPSGGKDEK